MVSLKQHQAFAKNSGAAFWAQTRAYCRKFPEVAA